MSHPDIHQPAHPAFYHSSNHPESTPSTLGERFSQAITRAFETRLIPPLLLHEHPPRRNLGTNGGDS